jgi:metal-responsive CopG/Arc/MetJ family transcriptional regulator
MLAPASRLGYDFGYTSRVKTAISLPDPLFEAAEELAADLGVSRSELYARALAEFVEKRQAQTVREALDTVYAEESSAPEPSFKEAGRRTLRRAEW